MERGGELASLGSMLLVLASSGFTQLIISFPSSSWGSNLEEVVYCCDMEASCSSQW